MACVDVGKLRAFCDGELSAAEAAGIESHLAGCARCKADVEDLQQTSLMVARRVSSLTPTEAETPALSASLAGMRQRLASQNEERRVVRRFLGFLATAELQWRATAAGLAAVLVIASVLAFPPARSLAGELLGIFRVQKFAPVSVDLQSIDTIPMLDPTKMGTLEGISQMPTIHTGITTSEAAAKVDFPIRLPAQLPAATTAEPRLGLMEGFSVAYTFDLAKANAYLASLGLNGVNLPKTPDGKKMSATVPPRVFAEFVRSDAPTPRLMLIQGRSPTLEIPAGVDTEEVRNAILSVPGLPPELVVQLRALDWQTTAPVPVIKGDTSRHVIVDGAEGLLVQSSMENIGALIWQKQDIVYILVGPVTDAELVAAANSMR